MAAGRNNPLWLVLTVSSLAVSLTLAEDCYNTWFAPDKYCCKDTALGCYDTDDPYSEFDVPCCYDDVNDVSYSLYTRSNRDSPKLIRRSDPLPSEFSGSKRTVFVSHGWKSGGDTEPFQAMKTAFLNKEDINVVVLNWPSHKTYYPSSASETRPVGKLTSLIMKKVVDEGGASYDRIWCVGHSLGSHVCGNAGRNTPQKISRITGLDPAGPWFESEPDVTVGLNPTDAQFVDIIHTDSSGTVTHWGTERPLGDMDFYVNGYDYQPGCWSKKKRNSRRKRVACSHSRAVEYFTESITSDCFIAHKKCTNYKDIPGSCSTCGANGVCAIMGYGATKTEGVYYLETSSDGKSPH